MNSREKLGFAWQWVQCCLFVLVPFLLVLVVPSDVRPDVFSDTYKSCLEDCKGPCCDERCAYAACVAEVTAKRMGMTEMTGSREWSEAFRSCDSQRQRIRQCGEEYADRRRQQPPPPTTVRGDVEWNVDRMGLDYRNFDLPKADPQLCEEECAADPKCKAWTYVKPNTIQGPRPRCWLKYDVPPPRKSDCCVSGVKRQSVGTRTFQLPRIGRYRLDWCRRWATDCGRGAADAFCQKQGFSKARSWDIDPDIGQRSPTYLIETGQICDQPACDGFKYIECE